MKKIIFILGLFMFFGIIFIQCTKTQEISKENTEFNSSDAFSKVLDMFKDKGITIEKDRSEKLELRNSFCYHNDPDSCIFVGFIHDTVFIPNVCSEAAVEYNLYWCEDIGQLSFTDFHATPLTPACDNIWDWWQHLYDQGHYTELSLSIDSFEYAASKESEENIAYVFALAYGYFCPKSIIRSDFNIQLCYQHCLKYNGRWSWPRFEWFKVDCGAMCCKRIREFCVNPADGSTYSSNEDYEFLFGKCGPDALNSGECTDGILIGDCSRECGPPPTN